MPPTFGWDNFEDIAIALTDKFPDTDPLTLRFTDMHKWITELHGFAGDPAASNESKLEAIQMALQRHATVVLGAIWAQFCTLGQLSRFRALASPTTRFRNPAAFIGYTGYA